MLLKPTYRGRGYAPDFMIGLDLSGTEVGPPEAMPLHDLVTRSGLTPFDVSEVAAISTAWAVSHWTTR
jgi:hypothetical protein